MKKSNNIYIKLIIMSTILFPITVNAYCGEYCEDLAPGVRLVKNGLVPLLQIAVPIGLILMGMIDLSKAVMAGKEDEMKKAESMFIKRCIYAVAVFFVITIVTLAMKLFIDADTGVEGTQEWYHCWSKVDSCDN